MTLCIIVNIIITGVTLFICLRTNEITAGILTALLAAWSIELTLGAIIKSTETKQIKTINLIENENKINNELNDSI